MSVVQGVFWPLLLARSYRAELPFTHIQSLPLASTYLIAKRGHCKDLLVSTDTP